MSESSSSPTSPKWRRRAEARPAEIVQAAYQVFSEKGFAAARLDDIAQRAGVSKGALYLYFDNKQDGLRGGREGRGGAQHRRDREAGARLSRERSSSSFAWWSPRIAEVAASANIGKVLKMVVGESGNFPEIARIWHDDVVARGLGLMTALISRAQERGEVRAGDARNHAVSIISPMLVGVIFRETFVPVGAKPFDIPALMQQHLDTVLPGLLTGRGAT